jgi:thiamine biosynthesis lipoprotein
MLSNRRAGLIEHGGVTEPVMGTLVTIAIEEPADDARDRYQEAFDWFHRVEACASRFDPTSELNRLHARAGEPFVASEMLFHLVEVAVAVADASGGAFDPAVGSVMMRHGFTCDYVSGRPQAMAGDLAASPSHYDVLLDRDARTITLARPVLLDLGGIAKGFAVDLAARSLKDAGAFAIDAGGDLYLGGMKPGGRPWTVGIRHPRDPERTIETLAIADAAVCTSGDYERGEHHLIDPREGGSESRAASATVIAPTAALADALSTAAFVLGPTVGIPWLERQGVEGLIITPDLQRFATAGLPHVLFSNA